MIEAILLEIIYLILFSFVNKNFALESSVFIEVEHADIEDGEIFALQFILLCVEQVAHASHEFHGVFQSQSELFAEQVITHLCALGALFCSLIHALVCVGLRPIVFDSRIECCLLVEEIELVFLFLYFCLTYGCFCLSVVEDGHTES